MTLFFPNLLALSGQLSGDIAPTADILTKELSGFIATVLAFGTTWFLIQIKNMKSSQAEESHKPSDTTTKMTKTDEAIALSIVAQIAEVLESLNTCNERQDRVQKRYDELVKMVFEQKDYIKKQDVEMMKLKAQVFILRKDIKSQKDK